MGFDRHQMGVNEHRMGVKWVPMGIKWAPNGRQIVNTLANVHDTNFHKSFCEIYLHIASKLNYLIFYPQLILYILYERIISPVIILSIECTRLYNNI